MVLVCKDLLHRANEQLEQSQRTSSQPSNPRALSGSRGFPPTYDGNYHFCGEGYDKPLASY